MTDTVEMRFDKVIYNQDDELEMELIAEGVNYRGENCRVWRVTIYERMEADPHPPDLGVHVRDGIEPKMKRG